MSKIKTEDYIAALKYLEEKRRTYYANEYPFNCGYIYANKGISFDCIGLIKTLINNIKVAYKKTPVGYYVKPGKKIADGLTEDGILATCTDVSSNFKSVPECSYMLHESHGHAGIYVGEYRDPSGIVNTIECTPDWYGGVQSSYCDSKGVRYDFKGGTPCGRWIKHGKLTKYLDYPAEKKKSITTIAKEVIKGKWGDYPERKKRLEAAGYDYRKVQDKVNELLKKK